MGASIRRYIIQAVVGNMLKYQVETATIHHIICRYIYMYQVYPPPRMPVTTRNIPFLVGNPYKLLCATVTGWGGRSNIYIYIHVYMTSCGYELVFALLDARSSSCSNSCCFQASMKRAQIKIPLRTTLV